MTDRHDSARHETRTPSHDVVARRAYELFQARGGEPGHALEHWLEAERELSRILSSACGRASFRTPALFSHQ